METEKSIDVIEAELDKEFYDEFTKLIIKYHRDFNPTNQVIRLPQQVVDNIKKNYELKNPT